RTDRVRRAPRARPAHHRRGDRRLRRRRRHRARRHSLLPGAGAARDPGRAGAGQRGRCGAPRPASRAHPPARQRRWYRGPDPGYAPGMARINDHYLKLAGGYLFPEIGRRVKAFQDRNPGAEIIRLGIGDVVLPIGPSIRAAMHKAIDELGAAETFKGYSPDQGYDFLRDAIVEHDFKARGATVSPDEVFVSDGSKCDSGNIQEIFAAAAKVAIPDPVYPVYVDSNVMAGRTGAA